MATTSVFRVSMLESQPDLGSRFSLHLSMIYAIAPRYSKHPIYRLPIFEIRATLCLPPVEWRFGREAKPIEVVAVWCRRRDDHRR